MELELVSSWNAKIYNLIFDSCLVAILICRVLRFFPHGLDLLLVSLICQIYITLESYSIISLPCDQCSRHSQRSAEEKEGTIKIEYTFI